MKHSNAWAFALFSMATLTGCSTHPLPSDLIDLSIYDLVHKVQCEAADTIRQLHTNAGFTEASRNLAKLEMAVQEASKTLEGFRSSFQEANDYGTTYEALEEADQAIGLQALQVKQEAERILASTDVESVKRARLAVLAQENSQLDKRKRIINGLLGKWKLLEAAARTVNDLNKQRATYAKIIDFERNKVTFQFIFEIQEDNNATSKGTFTWPIALGTFSLGYDVGDKKSRLSDRRVTAIETFGELLKLTCGIGNVGHRSEYQQVEHHRAGRYPMQGNIGLEEVIIEYLRLRQSERLVATGESYSDKIQFTTTLNGALKPSVAIARSIGQKISAEAEIGISRKDKHEVTLTLSPRSAPGAPLETQPIAIVQLPAVRVRANVVRLPPQN